MTDHHDVIAAFVDNEPVGAADLASALAAPAGRDYLIDLLVLRGLVSGAPNTKPVTAARAGSAARSTHKGLWLTAAAALVAVGVSAGFFAGRVTLGGRIGPRVASDVAGPAGATTTAPAPTHVIRMEKGVDWNERSGGN